MHHLEAPPILLFIKSDVSLPEADSRDSSSGPGEKPSVNVGLETQYALPSLSLWKWQSCPRAVNQIVVTHSQWSRREGWPHVVHVYKTCRDPGLAAIQRQLRPGRDVPSERLRWNCIANQEPPHNRAQHMYPREWLGRRDIIRSSHVSLLGLTMIRWFLYNSPRAAFSFRGHVAP